MTKTELRKLKTKSVLNLLVEEFNAYNIESSDGGRIDFWVDYKDEEPFQFQYHRTYESVDCYDATTLAGVGWTTEEISRNLAAHLLESKIIERVGQHLASL